MRIQTLFVAFIICPWLTIGSSSPTRASETLSLHFEQVEVRVAIQAIADFTNLNMVVADSVAGHVSLRLKDVPWEIGRASCRERVSVTV